MKKKFLTTLACAGALAVPVAAAPAASADAGCSVVGSSNTLSVQCPNTAPGTQFRVVHDCTSGRYWSRWEDQGHWTTGQRINLQCQNIRLVEIQFR